MNKDIAYLIKVRIDNFLAVCKFNQVCKAANLHEVKTLSNGKKHGFWKWYWENGQLGIEETYKDGEAHGLWKWYWENGQLATQGVFRDGKQCGLWKWYRENGQLQFERTYKDGKFKN